MKVQLLTHVSNELKKLVFKEILEFTSYFIKN